jgi:hypothetical protein
MTEPGSIFSIVKSPLKSRPRRVARGGLCVVLLLAVIGAATAQMPPPERLPLDSIVRDQQSLSIGDTELNRIGMGSEGFHISEIPIVQRGTAVIDPDRVKVVTEFVALEGSTGEPGAKAYFVEDSHVSRDWKSQPLNWDENQRETLEVTCRGIEGTEVIGLLAVLLYDGKVMDAVLRGAEAHNEVLAEQLALLMANSLGEELYDASPFSKDKDTALGGGVEWRDNRYLWTSMAGRGQSDLSARVSFRRDGSHPVVEVKKRVSTPQEQQLMPEAFDAEPEEQVLPSPNAPVPAPPLGP